MRSGARKGPALRAATAALAALAVIPLGCARPPEPVLVPPAVAARQFLGEVRRGCEEIVDFEARGTIRVKRGVWDIEARERVLYLAPDRMRFSVESGGIFGLGAVGADFLLRADSLYLHVSGQGTTWAGLREEFNAEWPRRAPIVWAILDDVSPGAPIGCGDAGGNPGCTLPDTGEAGADSKDPNEPFSIICPAGDLDRVVWIDPRSGLPEESSLYGADDSLLVRILYADYEELEGFQRPSRIDLRYDPEGVSLRLEHLEQRLNVGLSESDFLPLGGPTSKAPSRRDKR